MNVSSVSSYTPTAIGARVKENGEVDYYEKLLEEGSIAIPSNRVKQQSQLAGLDQFSQPQVIFDEENKNVIVLEIDANVLLEMYYVPTRAVPTPEVSSSAPTASPSVTTGNTQNTQQVSSSSSYVAPTSTGEVAVGMLAILAIQQKSMKYSLEQQKSMINVINLTSSLLSAKADDLVKQINDTLTQYHKELYKAEHKKGFWSMIIGAVEVLAALVIIGLTAGAATPLAGRMVAGAVAMLVKGLTQGIAGYLAYEGHGNPDNPNSTLNNLMNDGLVGFAGAKAGKKASEGITIAMLVLALATLAAGMMSGAAEAGTEVAADATGGQIAKLIASILAKLLLLANAVTSLVGTIKGLADGKHSTQSDGALSMGLFAYLIDRMLRESEKNNGNHKIGDKDEDINLAVDIVLGMGLTLFCGWGATNSPTEFTDTGATNSWKQTLKQTVLKLDAWLNRVSREFDSWLSSGLGPDFALKNISAGLQRISQFFQTYSLFTQADSSVMNLFTALAQKYSTDFNADQKYDSTIYEQVTSVDKSLSDQLNDVYKNIDSNYQTMASSYSDTASEINQYLSSILTSA